MSEHPHPLESSTVSRRAGMALAGTFAASALAACGAGKEPSAAASPTLPGTPTSAPGSPRIAGTDGLVDIACTKPVPELVTAFEKAAKDKGLEVFATIDHAAGATKAGLKLRPTTLVIVGNAKGGTPLMEDVQRVGLALPLHVLFWENDKGERFATYEDINAVATRYGLGEASAPARSKIAELLGGLIHEVSS